MIVNLIAFQFPFISLEPLLGLSVGKWPTSLGTIKASQVVVLNKDSVVVTQRKLM